MARITYDRLIRDRIPEIIETEGKQPTVRTLETGEYLAALRDKLLEEAGEVESASTRDALLQELADVLEVVQAIAAANDLSLIELEHIRQQRHWTRGGFEGRTFLEAIEEPD